MTVLAAILQAQWSPSHAGESNCFHLAETSTETAQAKSTCPKERADAGPGCASPSAPMYPHHWAIPQYQGQGHLKATEVQSCSVRWDSNVPVTPPSPRGQRTSTERLVRYLSVSRFTTALCPSLPLQASPSSWLHSSTLGPGERSLASGAGGL